MKRESTPFYRWFFALLLAAVVFSGAMPARAKEQPITYPVIPYQGDIPEEIHTLKKLTRMICKSMHDTARGLYVERGTGEASASDGSSYGGDDGYFGEDPVLYEEDFGDDWAFAEVAEDDSWTYLDSPYEEPVEDYGEDPGGYGEYLGQFTATAYCSCSLCTGDYATGYTASGTLATEGRTVACNVLPLGSVVSVNGCTYVVEDTGWTPYGDAWIDFYFDSHDAALAFGVQTVDVYLIG